MIDSGNQHRLWQAHLHLTADLVRDYCFSSELTEDALQEVRLGLWEATFEWREDLHEKFAHYAWLCMRRRLLIYLTTSAVEKPRLSPKEKRIMGDLKKHLRTGEMISCKLMDLIGTESGISRFRLGQLVCYWYASSTALSASTLMMIEEECAETQDTTYSEKHYQTLDKGLEALSERERLIIIARYLEDPRKTLAELAGILGVSTVRVSQIENAAMKRLRAHMQALGKD